MSEPVRTASSLQRTPLFAEHQALKARIMPFGGWEMPIEYTGILDEHRATRSHIGLFDLSHMGEFHFSGPRALDLLSWLITNDPVALAPGQGQYSPMCYESGTIVDDVIVYHLPGEPGRYLMVVNAANIGKDWQWVNRAAGDRGLTDQVLIENRSTETALIAIQGPYAARLLAGVAAPGAEPPPFELRSFAIGSASIDAVDVLAARTGYTGEDGFELLHAASDAVTLWRLLLEAGADLGIKPVGLGARDTLRLEARLPLYGNDLSDQTSPLAAGLGRWVHLEKPGGFSGSNALSLEKERGSMRKLSGIAMLDRSIPRAHYPVLTDQGIPVAELTSGSFSPTLGRGIALAYLPIAQAAPGTAVQIAIRGQNHLAEIVKTPFYKRPR